MGEPPGDTAIYPHSRPDGVITADCIKLTPDRAVTDERFLAFALRAEPARSQILERAIGVAQQKLSLERFREVQIPLPPLAEQQRIVAKVEQLLAQVNAARDRLAKVPAILKRFRQSVLAAACSGRLTEEWRPVNEPEPVEKTLTRIQVRESNTGRAATDQVIPGVGILSVGMPDKEAPPGWKWLPLTDVAKLESGHTPSRKHPEYWNGKTAWIGILDAGAHHGGVIHKTLQTITQAGLDNSAARLLPAGTVCLSRTASVGYVVSMR
jgi:type I restriction enzyme S subunit